MAKLIPSPLGEINKPLARMEAALADVHGELEALKRVERELTEGFKATCERLDRIADLLEGRAT